MENKKPNELQIEITEDIAQGTYANLAVIAHSDSEFIIDFARIVPGSLKAKVQSRIILTPENAKRLLFALQDNIEKFEARNNGNIAKFEDVIPPAGGIKN
jgi:Protein of unknown function (DUF3467).